MARVLVSDQVSNLQGVVQVEQEAQLLEVQQLEYYKKIRWSYR